MATTYSRKQFLRQLGIGSLTLSAVASASTACSTPEAKAPISEKEPAHALVLGMASYTLRKFDLPTTIAMTQRVGLKHICLKSMHLPLDSSTEEIQAAMALIKAAGIDPYGAGVIYMKTAEEVEQAFRYAQAAGMKIIVGVPNHELLPLVEQKVKDTDIRLAIHNHGPGDDLYSSADDVWAQIKNRDERIGFCLDIGHVVRIGEDPIEKIEKYGSRLYDMHFKDVDIAEEKGTSQEMGRGIIDIPGVVRALQKVKYNGIMSLEFEKDGDDPLPGIAESVGYARGILKMLS